MTERIEDLTTGQLITHRDIAIRADKPEVAQGFADELYRRHGADKLRSVAIRYVYPHGNGDTNEQAAGNAARTACAAAGFTNLAVLQTREFSAGISVHLAGDFDDAPATKAVVRADGEVDWIGGKP